MVGWWVVVSGCGVWWVVGGFSGSQLSQEVSSSGRQIGQEGQVEYSKGVHLGLVLQICEDHFSNRAGFSWFSWLSYLSWFSWFSWRGFGDLGS